MKSLVAILVCSVMLVSCGVISPQVRKTSVSVPSFEVLVRDVAQYRDQTIILGGYLLEVQNKPDQTVMTALQVPLNSGQRPGSKDRSQGRLIIASTQFLDPEIYTKGRKITVAGKVIGSSQSETNTESYAYLRLEAIEVYLWPQYRITPTYYPYPYNDPYWFWNDPWYWRPYPYRFDGRFHRWWPRYYHDRPYHRHHRR